MNGTTDHDNSPGPGRLLTTAEAAAAFRVHPKTIQRWAQDGNLEHIRTPTGFYRFREAYIRGLLSALNGGQS